VQEYIRRRNLRQYLNSRSGRLPWPEAVQIIGSGYREDFVARWSPASRNRHAAENQLKVTPLVTRLNALGKCRVGSTLKTGAGDIKGQQVVFEVTQLIERSIQAIIIDLLIWQSGQIWQCRFRTPPLRDRVFTESLKQP